MAIRILRIIARLNVGGPAIHTVLLNEGLERRGFETVLLTGTPETGEADMGDLARRAGISVETVPELSREIRPLKDLSSLYRVARAVRRFRPHVVHTHTAKAGLIGRLAAVMARVPVRVHTFHGHVFHGYFGPAKTTFFLNLERALAAFSNRLVAISARQKLELACRYRVAPESKFEVVELGFAHLQDLASARVSQRAETRRTLNISDHETVIGIVGRLVPIKDHRTFLSAAADLSRKRKNVRFMVVGDGPLSAELRSMAHELGIEERVLFLGWRRDLPAIYAAMDLLCLSSLNEGTPVTVIEALAAGVPVVATDVGGVNDVLQDGRWGLTVPPANPKALAKALEAAIGAPGDPVKAQNRALDRYSSERLLNDVESLYIRLLDETGFRKRPGP